MVFADILQQESHAGPVDMACQTDRNDDWRVMTHRLPKLKPPPPPPRSWADALRDCLPGRHNAAVVPVDIADGFATIHVHADGRGCVLAPRVSRRWVHVANPGFENGP